jgi:hypothetical protein
MRQVVRRQLFVAAVTAALLIATGVVAVTIRQALEDQRRWDEMETALDSLQSSEHEWDRDPAGWVRQQRRGDRRRVG